MAEAEGVVERDEERSERQRITMEREERVREDKLEFKWSSK